MRSSNQEPFLVDDAACEPIVLETQSTEANVDTTHFEGSGLLERRQLRSSTAVDGSEGLRITVPMLHASCVERSELRALQGDLSGPARGLLPWRHARR